MFQHSTRASFDEVQRMEGLMLLIAPTVEEERELNTLQSQHGKQSSVAFDADDPDPECVAARAHIYWREQYDRAERLNKRTAALAERYYQQQGKQMNSYGFKQSK